MKKRKIVIFLILIFIITGIGFWGIRRKKEDSAQIDVENVPDTEGFDNVEETDKAENQSSNFPKVYWDIIDQYNEIIEADVDDMGQEAVQQKFLKGGEWEFVWDELYAGGNPDKICYSLEDLTGDGFPEMIMGLEAGGYWLEGQFIESYFEPYVIYYYNSDNEIEMGIAKTKWYKMCLYEGGIVELIGSGVSEPRIYAKFASDSEKWDTVAMIGIEWDYENGKKTGYYQEEVNETDQINHKMISEKEYLSIIEKYTGAPIRLEWEKINKTDMTGQKNRLKNKYGEIFD